VGFKNKQCLVKNWGVWARCLDEAMPRPVYFCRLCLLKLGFTKAGYACGNKCSLGCGG